MKHNRKILMVMLTVLFVLLAACGNASDELNAKSDKQLSNSDSTQDADKDLSNKDLTDIEKDTTENASQGAGGTERSNQEDTSDHATTKSDDGGPAGSSHSDRVITENKKDGYLKKLNEMEEADRYLEAGTTMLELEEQEADRYKKWDMELNEIYGVLEAQLSKEQMDKLREEQRNWVIIEMKLQKNRH